VSERILPDGCADIVIALDDGTATAVGTMTRPLLLAERAAPAYLGARFRDHQPARAAARGDRAIELLAAGRSVDAVASEVNLSRQHLRRRVLEHVGVGPKTFARAGRLHAGSIFPIAVAGAGLSCGA
jgi:methylphosphotriester-DNA--protein-cysteine methyltransferase